MIENQIQRAKADGQMDGLVGEGEPLPFHHGGDVVAAGFGVMAKAGVLPHEIVLKKAVQAQQATLTETTDPVARKEEMRKLADLHLRLAIEQEARRKFYRTSKL